MSERKDKKTTKRANERTVDVVGDDAADKRVDETCVKADDGVCDAVAQQNDADDVVENRAGAESERRRVISSLRIVVSLCTKKRKLNCVSR